MATHGYGKDVLPITAQVAAPKRDYLDARAARLNWSRAEIVEQVIEFFFAMGCPPLSEIEAHASRLPAPAGCRAEMRPYWTDLANSDHSTPRAEAARLLAQQRTRVQESDAADHQPASPAARRRPRSAR